jgi:hypothetical protein
LVLVRETDASGLTAWSLKRAAALRAGDGERLVAELVSANPAYDPRMVELDESGDANIEALVREVLQPVHRERGRGRA